MANNLSMKKRSWLLKECFKLKTLAVRRSWLSTFGSAAPSRQTIYSIRDKFNATGSVKNAPTLGRPRYVCTVYKGKYTACCRSICSQSREIQPMGLCGTGNFSTHYFKNVKVHWLKTLSTSTCPRNTAG